MNITTPAGSQARITEMENMYFSDFHKDVYGYRPRGGEYRSWVAMSPAAFNDALDSMMDKLEADETQRLEDEAEALNAFKSELRETMEANRIDWKSAVKRMMLAVGETDVGFWLWEKGLSFAKQNEIKEKFYA